MKYILDTCAISEVVKTTPSPKALSWISGQADVDLYPTVITVGAIRKGIEQARPKNPEAALKYETWLDGLVLHYADRILPLDEAAAQTWGTLMATFPRSGVEDAQIAAIAMTQDMAVATKNVSDFAIFPVKAYVPF